jgi:putative colanic acid biosynthesis acetyltransferase WcaF
MSRPGDTTSHLRLSTFDNRNFDRGAPRWKEALWFLVRRIFFDTQLPVPSAIKTFWLRRFGAKIGHGVVIRSKVNITFPWRFRCGNDVWIGDEVLILSLAEVAIGNDCCISQRSFLCTGSHDFSRPSFDLITAPIKIADGCWVCARVFLGPGTILGPASRCLPGAVVHGKVEGGTTVGGVPAKIIETLKDK